MRDRRRGWTLLLVGAAICVGSLARESWRALTYDDRVPVRFDRVELLNSPIAPGYPLLGRVWRTKVRDDCPVTSERTAVNTDGEVFDLVGVINVPGAAAGTPFVDVAYPTPPDLPPGDYALRVMLTYACPGLTHHLMQPVTYFRVRLGPAPGDVPALMGIGSD